MLDGSPRNQAQKREILREFNRVKTLARLPTFLYLIQRL
jgi:hypothetical protein